LLRRENKFQRSAGKSAELVLDLKMFHYPYIIILNANDEHPSFVGCEEVQKPEEMVQPSINFGNSS